ncbi:uncharacterized protein M421DRAFT_137113 [Didymella exigua CBS 183.55]|uniref:Uncharacterized protein n=1 Tax=Didymella exigua CBS 183.55 TaxID=1150837 RepID=A0A6A5RLP4_9PLEO|nr:uncharacterized protein M421DRAFT_137113 [Didymella exigua CBS 183.55]KAF1929351.1 hypothetical protein M421DRAFT_137113 [Didymella exigua CBS 183.55]
MCIRMKNTSPITSFHHAVCCRALSLAHRHQHTACYQPSRQQYLQASSHLRRLTPWLTSEGSMLQSLHHTYQPFFVMTPMPAVLFVVLLYGLVTAAFQVPVTLISISAIPTIQLQRLSGRLDEHTSPH